MQNLLEITDLKVDLMSTRGIVYALSGVNLQVRRGEIHGLVGESGCGKSVTAKSVMRLLDPKRSRVSGKVLFDGLDLCSLSEKEMRMLRGNRISMIFQDPMSSLNPLMTVGDQIAEAILNHARSSRTDLRERTLALLEKVGLQPPEKRIGQYPFELSGGMQQRVMIAIAIAQNPDLLIADEPTTALDVTIQAQILDLLRRLQRETGLSILLITHNFGIVAEVCDRVSVMYAGKVIETAPTGAIFRNPAHYYSRALIQSIPRAGGGANGRLPAIAGSPPQLYSVVTNCSFAPRCPRADELCRAAVPSLREYGGGQGHMAMCHHMAAK